MFSGKTDIAGSVLALQPVEYQNRKSAMISVVATLDRSHFLEPVSWESDRVVAQRAHLQHDEMTEISAKI
jgi:hypothetical protein